MTLKKALASISFLLVLATTIWAQNNELRGFIYEKATGDPVPLANLYLMGTTTGTVSTLKGYYSIQNIKPGTYTVRCLSIGYDTAFAEISISNGQVVTQTFYLAKAQTQLGGVTINEKRTARKTDPGVSVVTVTKKQIERIPSIGGSPDFAQYIQILPGVVFTGDQGGQLYIRGGSPIQNKVILDGMTVYNPFHSIGLFSVFDTEIIRSADVYTGGFPAEYGGRISAIMDIKTREGNKEKFRGVVEASPFTSKLMLEGPLKPYENGLAVSYILTGRTSYLKHTAPVLYSYADDNGLPYAFNDLYGKLSLTGKTGSKVDFFGFTFNDNVEFANATNYSWKANGAGTKLQLVPEGSPLIMSATLAFSDYEMNQIEIDSLPRRSRINGFEANIDFNYFSRGNALRYGVQFIGFNTDFQFRNAANRTVGQEEFTTELAAYTSYKFKKGRLILEPGFRYHYFASLAEGSAEPRILGKVIINDWMRFKYSGGYFAQNLLSARSDRDVVNLFYGFLSGPDEIPSEFKGEELRTRLQKARHIIGGLEFDLGQYSFINFETYYKYFNQLTNINRNKVFDNNSQYFDKDLYLRSDYIVERGRAYGFDLNYEYENDRWYAWATYSLSWVTRTDEYQTYYPHWDRRHNSNVLISYEAGKKRNWEMAARWNFGSGFPFTLTQGFYERLDFSDGLDTDYLTENGDLGIIYSDLNTGRLSSYHRLDVSAKWTKELKNSRKMQFTASASNLYNRNNVFYFDRISYKRVNQLPILPSVAFSYNF
ncbi:MAG: TonB-dependent receptor [Bacteroidetes bacterium]|nr:TonB-dependent receptor [Bacteroidota bacterium]